MKFRLGAIVVLLVQSTFVSPIQQMANKERSKTLPGFQEAIYLTPLEQKQDVQTADYKRMPKEPFYRVRELLQETNNSPSRGYSCSLTDDVMMQIYEPSTGHWTIDDKLLEDLDYNIQIIINCTRKGDNLLFKTDKIIKPKSSLVIQQRLTLSAHQDKGLSQNKRNGRMNSQVTFTCPEGADLLISKTASLIIENVNFVNCQDSGNIIILDPVCGDDQNKGATHLIHVKFKNNSVSHDQRILKVQNRSCMDLLMDNVLISGNTCNGTECILLSSTNTLNHIQIHENQGKLRSQTQSMFNVPAKSETTAHRVLAKRNQIRLFNIVEANFSLSRSKFYNNTEATNPDEDMESVVGGNIISSLNATISISGSVFQNNTSIQGGCLHAISSNIKISSSSFLKNNANEGSGGAAYFKNSSVSITSCNFTMNHALMGGAIHAFSKSLMNITKTSFNSNLAIVDGGSIFAEQNTSMSCSASIFKGNEAEYGGGIRCWIETSTIILNCKFHNNEARRTGGAIHIRTNSTLQVQDTSFTDHKATYAGAIRFQEESKAVIKNCTFKRNFAEIDGGGINVHSNSTVEVANSTFTGHNAEYGGAIFCYKGSNCQVDGCIFNNNNAEIEGGGINMWKDSIAFLSNSTFSENTSEDGAAIFSEDNVTIRVSFCKFKANRSLTYGGAVGVEDTIIYAVSCIFQGNHAKYGGAMSFYDGGNGSLSNCSFTNNTARINGGALYLEHNSSLSGKNLSLNSNSARDDGGGLYASHCYLLEIKDSKFSQNKAVNGAGLSASLIDRVQLQFIFFMKNEARVLGGALYLNSLPTKAMLSASSLEQNYGDLGGAMYLSNVSMDISKCTFTMNYAKQIGGGMLLNKANATVEASTFKGNDAFESCGGICARDGSCIIGENLTIASNSASTIGGGIGIVRTSCLLCYKCSIIDNKASHGAGLYVEGNGQLSIIAQLQNTVFRNNTAEMYGGGMELNIPESKARIASDVLLIGCKFIDNRAGRGGPAILTSHAKGILSSCIYRMQKEKQFLNKSDMTSFKPLHPQDLCKAWKGNKVSTNISVGSVSTLGQKLNFSIESTHGVQLVSDMNGGLLIKNVTSGKPLPTLNVTVLDGFGLGPAATSLYTFEVQVSAPNNFFEGIHTGTITAGEGTIPNIVGVVSPGNYTLEVSAVEVSISSVNITVQVRECGINEENTTDGKLCQECDALSYNFHERLAKECKRCPEHATCKGHYIEPDDGYWHWSPCDASVMECLNKEACSYIDRSKNVTNITTAMNNCTLNKTILDAYHDALCNEGYEGVLCNSCQESYGLTLGFRCSPCGHIAWSILTILGVAGYLLFMSSLTVRGGLPSTPSKSLRILEGALPEVDNTKNAAPAHLSKSVKTSFRQSKKLIGGQSSRSNAYFSVLSEPREVSEEIELGPVNEAQCNNTEVREKEPTQMETMPGTNSTHFDLDAELELTKRRTTEILKTLAIAAAVNVQWTESILQMFKFSEHCGGMTSGGLTKPTDCILSANSAVYRTIWRAFVILLIPGSVIVVFLIFWVIRAIKEKLGPKHFQKRLLLSINAVIYISYVAVTKTAVRAFHCIQLEDQESGTKHRYLAEDTKVECYQGEHYILVAMGLLVLIMITLTFPIAIAYAILAKARNQEQQLWKENTIGFLYKNYKKSFSYWESIVMCRKALLTIVVVFAYPLGGEIQGLLAAIILIIFLSLHLVCKPYGEHFIRLNYFEAGSLLMSTLTFILAQLFNSEKCTQLGRLVVSLGLIVLNVFFTLFLCFSMIGSAFAHISVRFRKIAK